MSRIKKLLIFLTLLSVFFIDVVASVEPSKVSISKSGIDTERRLDSQSFFNPDTALSRQAIFLAFELTFKPYDLPIALFDLKGVKKISIKGVAKDSFVEFNQQGQWIKAGSTRDTVFLTYKNGLPDQISNNIGLLYEFHYVRDTVITVNAGRIDYYFTEGDFLLKRKTYLKDSQRTLSYIPVSDGGEGIKMTSDIKTTADLNNPLEDEPPVITQLSNVHWQYPLHAYYNLYDHSSDQWKVFKKEYQKNQQGDLTIKYLLDNYITYVIFILADNRPVRMLSAVQTLSQDPEPQVIHSGSLEKTYFTYTYFEK